MNARTLSTVALGSLVSLGLAGYALAQTTDTTPTDTRTTETRASDRTDHDSDQPITDTWITTKVKTELATTDGVKSMDISVKTVDGVVTLTGTQPDANAVRKATAATESIKGVVRVDASGLKVDSNANVNRTTTAASTGTAGQATHNAAEGDSDQPITDTWITTKVKTELATTDGVKSMDIDVKTVDGVVTLIGTQPDETAVKKAVAATESVKGVVRVDASGLKAR